MKVHKHEGTQTSLAEINIIPLVDVILVLLIIFMVAAPLMQQGIDIDLPEVSAKAVKATKEDFVLSIDGDGKIFLGKEKAAQSLASLEEKLHTIFENKEKKELFLRADKGVEYGYVVKIMALCQKAGIERMGMITTPETDEKN